MTGIQELTGRVAVITGAGSGFGQELAVVCAEAGMRLVLADVDPAGLASTQQRLGSAEVLSQACDVSKADQVEALAAATYARFGACHLLFNNAGVAVAGPLWTSSAEDWQWVLGVNLMGVVHGVQAFVPRMLKAGEAGHIINTASLAGLTSPPGSSVYCVSKHGVVTLSECLHHELRMQSAPIGVSVLCPAFVKTGIADSARHRPEELARSNPLAAPFEAQVKKAIEAGRLSAREVAVMTLAAVQAGDFYIVTHKGALPSVEQRLRDVLDNRPPTNPFTVGRASSSP